MTDKPKEQKEQVMEESKKVEAEKEFDDKLEQEKTVTGLTTKVRITFLNS